MRREVGPRVRIVVALVAGAIVVAVKPAAAEPTPARRVDYRVGFLGAPCHPHVEWNDANLEMWKEPREVMVRDQENMGTAEPLAAAVALLDADRPAFLATYFLPTGATGKKEGWTITSE
jgi:hypothetical protein